eukprot:759384-Hanusia_phi.AAC.1
MAGRRVTARRLRLWRVPSGSLSSVGGPTWQVPQWCDRVRLSELRSFRGPGPGRPGPGRTAMP